MRRSTSSDLIMACRPVAVAVEASAVLEAAASVVETSIIFSAPPAMFSPRLRGPERGTVGRSPPR